jgi:hypothetical protein
MVMFIYIYIFEIEKNKPYWILWYLIFHKWSPEMGGTQKWMGLQCNGKSGNKIDHLGVSPSLETSI